MFKSFYRKKADITDKTKSHNKIRQEKGLIISFRNLIKYIGQFRNMLAHNQPIFCYNHKDYSLINFPNMSYEMPWIDMKKNPNQPEIYQQHKINSVTMYDLASFFGADKYNALNSCCDINLSFIIYVIYKIISTIDKNTQFYDELINLFEKYNIILSLNKKQILNTKEVESLINEIEKINKLEIDYKELNDKIEKKESYKQELRNFISKFNESKRKLNVFSNKIKFIEIKSKYDPLPVETRYTDYTGIDKDYFDNIK